MRSLTAKLVAALIFSLTVAFLWLGASNLRLLRRNLESTLALNAQSIGDVIFRSTRHAMLEDNRESQVTTIESIGGLQGVLHRLEAAAVNGAGTKGCERCLMLGGAIAFVL